MIWVYAHTKMFEGHLSTWPWVQPQDTICLEAPGLVDKDQDRVESLGMLTISWVTSDKQGIAAANFSGKASWIQQNLRYAKINKMNTCISCIFYKSYPNKVQINIYLVKKQKKGRRFGHFGNPKYFKRHHVGWHDVPAFSFISHCRRSKSFTVLPSCHVNAGRSQWWPT